MLPDVVAEQRRLALAQRVVLVGGARDGERAAVEDEPRPARAELAGARGLELLLELVEGAERAVDRRGEVAVGGAAAVGAHRLPEQRVVVVPAAVVADGAALVLGDRVEVGDDLLDRRVGEVGALERRVDLVDVGLVMLVVMERHRLLVDVRLQRVVGVRKGGNLVCHRAVSLGSAVSWRTLPVGLRLTHDPPHPSAAAHRARAARRRRGAVAQAHGARRAHPPGRRRDCGRGCPRAGACTASVEQIVREEIDAIGGQEMLMPVLMPAEPWRRTGRYEIDELFKLKDRKRRRHGARDDPRGVRHDARRAARALLPRPAAHPLPLPDEGARRAAAARRRPAHARVHHEGRLHASIATATGLDVELREARRAPTTRSSSAAGWSGTASSPTSG